MSRGLTVLSHGRFLNKALGGKCYFSTSHQQSKLLSRFRWFGIPITLGVGCVGLLHLRRVLWKERDNPASPHPMTWQLTMFLQLPSRGLSRLWGVVMEKDIPPYLRVPLLGLYKTVFGCDLNEAEKTELRDYTSFKDLFVRKLKEGARPINEEHSLVSPIDGKVMHFGPVYRDSIEQVKGVKYSMGAFLGPRLADDWISSKEEEREGEKETGLFHVVLYLSPGDCHHFYSPTEWKPSLCRHLPGELLTVAPWAAKVMPGLFALNERIIMSGTWRHGLFVFAAVGAYNVGSIAIDMAQDVETNKKGKYLYGSFFDKDLVSQDGDSDLIKGSHIGLFKMGSSIVLIFEAPKHFKFVIKRNEKIKIGEPIGKLDDSLQL